jgi:hypothetical protein
MLRDEQEHATQRRAFLGGLATGAAALATGIGLTPLELGAAEAEAFAEPDAWLAGIKGQHKQYFDAVSVNDGFALAYAMNYMNTMGETYKITDNQLTAVVGLRHFSIPLAFNNEIWRKYRLGEFTKANDSATKAPALRNPYAYAKEGELMFPGMALEKLMARGAVVTVCNVALTILSGLAAQAAGLPKEKAKAEWTAGMFKGVHIVPSGVLAVGRAQEKGCTYCFAG